MAFESPAIAEVLLPLALSGTFSYVIPEGMAPEPGSYVAAPLGPRTMIGVVWKLSGTPPGDVALRPLAGVFDARPLGALHRRFVDWVANYYVQEPGLILRMVLRVPDALGPPREHLGVRATAHAPSRMTAQRRRVIEAASGGMLLRSGELAEMAGVGSSVIKGMIAEGALEVCPFPMLRAFAEPDVSAGGNVLSPDQERAAQELRAQVTLRQAGVTLLDGITGSGKTEVYFEAMAMALAAGKQTLLMLPEIALTGTFLARVERRFGVEAAHWHSDVRPRERERVWRGVADGSARIVIGARSALFLPWRNPGLFVVDEEHESAYKQEDGVPYHARDMAVVYGSLGQFPVILSSATPSLESLVNARQGRYGHVKLERRHNQAQLPRIDLIDMRAEKTAAGSWLSTPLFEAVKNCLAQGNQALLFLNRRGYAPLTLCRSCGHHLNCPNCSASLVEHRFRKQLQCHHCGFFEPMPLACSHCKAEGSLVPCGPGIERLAEEAAARFSEARVTILSSDISRGAFLKDTLKSIEQGDYNLIIGTQLVAKGHHFPHLTLVGVVDADLALESGDPRAGERTWQLMAQVAGRAGRAEKPGHALIQTYLPSHPLMAALQRGDQAGFLAEEIRVRESARMPPFFRLVALVISGAEAQETENLARQMRSACPLVDDIDVLGPSPAPLSIVRGRYRWRFLVRAARNINVQAFVKQWLGSVKLRGSLRVDIDVDPYSFL